MEAIVAGLHLDGDGVGARRTGLARGGLGQAQVAAEDCADLPGESQHRGRVAPARREADLEHPYLRGQDFRQRRADLCPRVEHQDALVLVPQKKLPARADHPLGDDAPELRALELRAVGQARAGKRDCHPLARRHVRRAANDRVCLSATDVHAADREIVGVRVLGALRDVSNEHRGQVRATAVHHHVLEPAEAQALDEILVAGQVDELGEPVDRQPH